MTPAEQEFKSFRAKSWKLTDPKDKDKVRDDYLGFFEGLVNRAVEWYIEQHGGQAPQMPPPSSCETDDWTDSAVSLSHAFNDLRTAASMVTAMRANPAMRYQMGGFGYLVYGTPWKEVPEAYKPYLRMRMVKPLP